MLEESISCSPGNDTKRSRSRRLHKATKRKTQRQTGAVADPTELPCLDALYEESKQSISQLEHFNPFEKERILAAADAVQASTSKLKFDDFASEGFLRLEQLPVRDEARADTLPERSPSCSASSPPVIQAILGPETQFGITESEFVRFCDEVETDEAPATDVKAKSIVDAIRDDFCGSSSEESPPQLAENTRKEPKSIVDAILEDFCGSPYSESPPKFVAEDATPIFRFKSQSLRTYSGIKPIKSRRNIAVEIASTRLEVEDGHTSDSSGLSVQEDLSQNVAPELDTVDLNNSVKVCENLLNLSSYFSQATSHEKSPPMSGSTPLSAIVEDIIKLKRKTCTHTRSRSIDEFLGFSDEESDSKEDTLKELLEDEDDVLQQINCDSLCYEKVVPKKSFAYNCSELESTLEDANAVIEEANKLMLSIEGLHAIRKENSTKSLPNCDKHEDISKATLESPARYDEGLFDNVDEIDLWNDGECLLNYKTQKAHSSPSKPTENERCLSAIDAGLQLYSVNENSEAVKQKKLSANLRDADFRHPMKELNKATAVDGDSTSKSMYGPSSSVFGRFSTSSRKSITISDEAKRKADGILTAFEQKEAERRLQTAVDVSKVRSDELHVASFVGFSTASRKPVVISDEAKRKANEILARFDQQEAEQKLTEGVDVSRASQDQKHLVESPSTVQYSAAAPISMGFSTASRKHISISVEAKRKADTILKEFEQEEREKRVKEEEDVMSMCPGSVFQGFSTASKKPIAISDEAKRKADEMLKEFDEEDREKRIKGETVENIKRSQPDEVSEEVKQKAQDLLMDIEFFEEAFDEELKSIPEVNNTQSLAIERKQNENDASCPYAAPPQPAEEPIFEGFKTASRKSIRVSEGAKQHAEQLLRKVENSGLPQDFLKCIEADLNSCSIDKAEQVDGALHKELHEKQNEAIVKSNEVNENVPAAPDPPSQECETVPQSLGSLKRKHSACFAEEMPKTPAVDSPRRLSFSERTPLNRIENAILHKTASLPLIKSTPKSALISRKNLLSLSKRKKIDSLDDAPTAPKTPEKTATNPPSPRCNANATPNLKQFFDSVSTSTPRLVRYAPSKVDVHHSKDSSIEADFRPINWEDANDSGRAGCRTSFAGDPNIVCSQISPSPKQRIERLKMYGEPPPISPILMVNKCRPSGLRRARSFVKP